MGFGGAEEGVDLPGREENMLVLYHALTQRLTRRRALRSQSERPQRVLFLHPLRPATAGAQSELVVRRLMP